MEGVTTIQKSSVVNSKLMLRHSLILENFSTANDGKYECSLVKDGLRVSRSSIELKPVVETKTEPTFVLGSKSASLSCVIQYDGKSPSNLIWLKNNVQISTRSDSNRFVIIGDNNTLIINNPIREDAGLYIARFSIPDSTHAYDCEVQYLAGPLVLDFEKSMNIIEGEELDLRCVVKGYPYAHITWKKDEIVINDSRVILSELYGHINAHLLIRRTMYSDAGVYACEPYSAQFPNDTSGKSVTVRIKDKLAALWPFLGIVGEVLVLCIVIFIYEKRRSKQIQKEDNAAREVDGSNPDKKEGLRHRNTNNPTA
uniref:Ig-like domain-containing protein n=1 Tax=Arion vulgaris TaxID=1028688 RepID=A0A0B7A908_9EUPU